MPGGTGARVMGTATGTDAPYPLATGGSNSTAGNMTTGSWTGLVVPSPTAAPPVPSTATPGASQARAYDNGVQGSPNKCFGKALVVSSVLLAFAFW